jgi:hypothetical protein
MIRYSCEIAICTLDKNQRAADSFLRLTWESSARTGLTSGEPSSTKKRNRMGDGALENPFYLPTTELNKPDRNESSTL